MTEKPREPLQAIRELVSGGFACSTALRGDPWLQPLARLTDFQDVLDEVLGREADARSAFEVAGGDRVLS